MSKKQEVRKFTLEDLKPVQREVNIPHPTLGDVNATFTVLPPQSIEYMDAYTKRLSANIGELSLEDKLKVTASLPVAVLLGWNEELFGPFSKDAAVELLSKPEWSWLMLGLNNVLEDGSSFYKQ